MEAMKRARDQLRDTATEVTHPRTLLAWVTILVVWLVLDALDIVDLHVEVDPSAIQSWGVTIQHLTGLALLIPAGIAAYRKIKAAMR